VAEATEATEVGCAQRASIAELDLDDLGCFSASDDDELAAQPAAAKPAPPATPDKATVRPAAAQPAAARPDPPPPAEAGMGAGARPGVGAAEADWLDFASICSAVSAEAGGGGAGGGGGGGGGGAWPGGSAPGSRAAGTVRTVPLRATALAALERARGECAARASRGGACASALTPSELEAKLLEKEGRRHLRSKRRDEKETRRLERVARKQKIGGMLMARQAAALAEGQLEEACCGLPCRWSTSPSASSAAAAPLAS
jgi:hypothetical protein